MYKMIGVLLIVLGFCALAWGGFSYKTREKVVDIGPIEASKTTTHHVPIAPVAGGVAVAAGIGLMLAGRK
jgi:hypothetical protein